MPILSKTAWLAIQIFSNCGAPPTGIVLFPQSTIERPGRVLVRVRGSKRLLVATTGIRSTAANGACADESVIARLGGQGGQADAEYRSASLFDVLVHSGEVRLSAAVAILSLVSGLAAAYLALAKAISDAQSTLLLAAAIFGVNSLLAFAKAVQEYRKL